MARVRLIHWNGPEGRERKLRLAAVGHQVEFDDAERLDLMRVIRSNPPEACVIDLSRLPSSGREVALTLRSAKDTRLVPIVFVDGDPEKVARIKTILPDATFTTWGRLKTALPRAIANAPAAPIVPAPSMYANRPTVAKLGIKDGMRVCVVSAPPGFADTLKPLPKGVRLSAKVDPTCDLFLCFVRAHRELATHLASLARSIDRQPLWIAWPKKASRVKSDLDGNVVRDSGLAAGWVDYKVCSIDGIWSGLAFKRRR